MTEIKRGALVKFWHNNPKQYEIGLYNNPFKYGQHIVYCSGVIHQVPNVIEIPPELAVQLEALGV